MGYFKDEIVPVIIEKRGGSITIDVDEFPRAGTTEQSLGKLRPCFKKEGGSVTPGNASGINDSAAAVVLMSAAEVESRKVKPLAQIIGHAQCGIDPKIMGMGPVTAIEKLVCTLYTKLVFFF